MPQRGPKAKLQAGQKCRQCTNIFSILQPSYISVVNGRNLLSVFCWQCWGNIVLSKLKSAVCCMCSRMFVNSVWSYISLHDKHGGRVRKPPGKWIKVHFFIFFFDWIKHSQRLNCSGTTHTSTYMRVYMCVQTHTDTDTDTHRHTQTHTDTHTHCSFAHHIVKVNWPERYKVNW